MMQEAWTPFRSKLLESGRTVWRSFSLSRNCASTRQSYSISDYDRILLSRHFASSTSKYDSRSFYSSCNDPHRVLWGNSPLRLHQRFLPKYPDLLSEAFHTSTNVNLNLFQNVPGVFSSEIGVNFKSFNKEFSIPGQLRFLHQQSGRRRVCRTFSSQKNSTPSSVDLSNDQKDDKKEEDPSEDVDKKLSVYQRFKKTYKEHGKVLVVVHLLTSSVWLGCFYTAAKCGVDVVPLLESWNLSEKFISPFRSGGLGSLALAYLMYKLATPARYTVTLGGTNLVIRRLKRQGKMQPVPKEDSLRELYRDGKEDLKSKSTNTKHRLRNMRHRLQGRVRRVGRRKPRDR